LEEVLSQIPFDFGKSSVNHIWIEEPYVTNSTHSVANLKSNF